MRKAFWDKRIPTLLGILLIIIGVSVTTFLVKTGTLLNINASPANEPKEVRISNITDASFTVSFTTEESVVGSLNYGKDLNLGQTALDERDQQTVSPHKVHSITVRKLDPQTSYFFTILSGEQTYLNEGNQFSVSTGATVSETPPSQNPLSGKLILPNGSPPSEAIVYLTLDNSQVISTLVKADGTYILPLNSLRTADLSSYYSISVSATVKMLVFGEGLKSNVLLSGSDISPVPTVTLSQDFDFTVGTNPVASPSANFENFPSFSSTSSASQDGSPQILTPKSEQGFSDQQPVFKGTAIPNETVEIIIHSDEQINTKITADANGRWNYRPAAPLSPGEHTITIIAKDVNGILRTITQSFVVYAEGQQINPGVISGTPTPTSLAEPTLTPTPTVIVASSPTPTITIAPTITIVATPTATPTIITTTPTPTSAPIPPTGNATTMTFGIIGLFIALIGSLLFLLARGGRIVL